MLAVGQVVSWGTGFDMLAILGPRIGQELAIANEVVFAGLTVMMTISALCGPLLGRTLVRRGAAPVLVAGSLLFTVGFVVLAFAGGVISYVLGWVVMGLAATCGLTTAAHTAVVERVGAESGRSLTLLMVFTGLSAAVFLPVTTVADQHLGWRGTLWYMPVCRYSCFCHSMFLSFPDEGRAILRALRKALRSRHRLSIRGAPFCFWRQ